jgi:alpha-tubulin suppressor-like RCC1 family protein
MRLVLLITLVALTGVGCVSQSSSSSGKLLTEGKSASADVTAAPLTVPNNVAPANDSGVSKVVAGLQHVCAIRAGELTCWGLNKTGQIGNGDSGQVDGKADPLTGSTYTAKFALTPYSVFPDGVSDVALGYEHTCAIRNGELFCWGSNQYGQIGQGTANTGVSSRPVSILTGAKQVAAHGRWTCVVSTTGQLACFGTRLVLTGAGAATPKLISAAPKVLMASGVSSVSLSANHGCVVMTSGALQCFGQNAMGEVGNGLADGADVANPFEVFSIGTSSVITTDSRTCAVVYGAMKCFGASLGDREIDRTAGGWKVATPTPYDAVFWNGVGPGLQSSASGAVLASSGDLAYGSFFNAGGAVQKVALGAIQFTYSETDLEGCMMFRNHAVKCWGSNTFGQLGSGSRSQDEPTIFQARDVKF